MEGKNLKLIDMLEAQVLTAQANEARTRAEFCAEINIRPIIEKNLLDWCKANDVSPSGGQKNIDAFFEASDSIQNHLKEAKKDVGTTSNLNVVKKTMATLFDALSKLHHNVNRDLLDEQIGFVISIGAASQENSAVCISAILRSFGEEHVVIDKEKTIFRWTKATGTIKDSSVEQKRFNGLVKLLIWTMES